LGGVPAWAVVDRGRTVFGRGWEREGGKRDFWPDFKGFGGCEYVIIWDFTGVGRCFGVSVVKYLDSPKVILW
jgi:hypothetical protein